MTRRQVVVPSSPFPSSGLLPKEEIQAASFVKQFPEYDGRGVRVAVLDTGVDPAAFGLDGKNKVVDLIDCSGSGDIALKPVEPLPTSAKDSGSAITLPGLSGRTLLVSPDWANPSGKWKVGFKRAYELFPGNLVSRRKRERKVEWDVKVATLLSQASKDVEQFDRDADPEKTARAGAAQSSTMQTKPAAASSAAATATSKSKDTDADTDTAKDKSDAEKKEDAEKEHVRKAKKADLEARLAYLNELSSDAEDPGPILDVVVWHDGKHWRSVVGGAEGEGVEQNIASNPPVPSAPLSDENKDMSTSTSTSTSEKATLDLRDKKPMTDYRKERHYERFGTQDLLTYSVNFYDDGQVISIVCSSGIHGTHVSSIVAANVEDNPDINGVAPGAEIVSLMIGDNRLDSLETHQALMRATKAIIDTECDICNMSFGEDAAFGLENRGQFVSMLRDEVIKKRNVIFVTSAGNSGPALTTVGAPATTSGVISVGAYETPSMQTAEYALLENVPAGPYTWSSRGPTFDGESVSIYAPGAAVTGVNKYNLQLTQLANGTSMASPNACGAIALVLSALKAEKIGYTPARIAKALKASSKDVDDPQNVGLIQVEALYKYLVAHKDQPDEDADFDVAVVKQGTPAPDYSRTLSEREGVRGVYLREKEETSRLFEAAVWVRPSFPTVQQTEELYNLDLKLALAASEPWVKTPSFLSLPSAGRNFNIRVDPTALPAGLHCAEIRAYDTATPGRVVFTIPVTVCKPETVSIPSHAFKEWHSTPGTIERRFLAVPEGVTWAELRFSTRNHASPVNLWVHCVQLQAEARLSKTESQSIVVCTAGETVTKSFNVVGGVTLEICASQFWSSLPSADVSLEIHFHGLTLDTGKSLTVIGGSELPRLQVSSKVRLEQFSPSVSFDRRRSLLRSSEGRITALGERDIMPDGKRLFQLVNTYTIKLADKTKIKPYFATSDNLYDNGFAVLTQILDARKRVLQWGSVYPKEIELAKGDYTLLLQIEHADYKVLERMKSMALGLEAQLGEKSKKLSLTVHRDHVDATTKADSNPFKNIKMPLGSSRPLVILTELKGDTADLYKSAKAGDLLLGTLKLGPGSSKASVDLTYVLPPKSKAAAGGGDEGGDAKEAPLLVDLQLGIVDKIKDDKEKKQFLETLLTAHPNHLPLLVAALKATKEEAEAAEISKAADAVLALVDEAELSSYLGKKALPAEEQSAADQETKKAMDEKKAAWSAAYARKIGASYKAKDSLEKQNDLFAKYRQFLDAPEKDPEFSLIAAKRDFAQERYGACLKSISALLDESLDKGKYKQVTELQRQCFAKLGWSPLVEYNLRWQLV